MYVDRAGRGGCSQQLIVQQNRDNREVHPAIADVGVGLSVHEQRHQTETSAF